MNNSTLPSIPSKRYFTIGEVSDLCGVKPHVLRYWEQEFTQLKPIKRRGNRRYYQHHEVLLIRRIRNLLYDQGFTISGARQQLSTNSTKNTAVTQNNNEQPTEAQTSAESDEFKLGFAQTSTTWQTTPIALAAKPETKREPLSVLEFDSSASALPSLRIVESEADKSPENPFADALLLKDYKQIRDELIAIREILNEES